MIENIADTFVIKTIYELEKFSEIVVNSKVEKELEDNNIIYKYAL